MNNRDTGEFDIYVCDSFPGERIPRTCTVVVVLFYNEFLINGLPNFIKS